MSIGNHYPRDIYSLSEVLAHRHNLKNLKEIIINPLYDEEDMLRELDFFFVRLDNPSTLTDEQLDELQTRYDAFIALGKEAGKKLILERLKSVKQSGYETHNKINRKIHERWVANFDLRLPGENYYFELCSDRENTFFLYENKGGKAAKDYQRAEKVPVDFTGISGLESNEDKAYFRRVLGDKLYSTKGLKLLAYVEQKDGTVSVAPLKSSAHHMVSGAASRGAGIIAVKPNEDSSYTVVARGLNSGAWCMADEYKNVSKVFSGNEIFMREEQRLKCLEIPSTYDPYTEIADEDIEKHEDNSVQEISSMLSSSPKSECSASSLDSDATHCMIQLDEGDEPLIVEPGPLYELQTPTPVETSGKKVIFPGEETSSRSKSLSSISNIDKIGLPEPVKGKQPIAAEISSGDCYGLAAKVGIFARSTRKSLAYQAVEANDCTGRRLSATQ